MTEIIAKTLTFAIIYKKLTIYSTIVVAANFMKLPNTPRVKFHVIKSCQIYEDMYKWDSEGTRSRTIAVRVS